MRESDFESFSQMISAVCALYGKPASSHMIAIWWGALREYDLQGVRHAFDRHVKNPDSGQFMPKPADVIRMVQGSTQDAALVAWSKVDKAVRHVGPYATVAFDDPVIHAVIQDMGGWVQVGSKTDKDWPFIAKEFETRYRGYRLQGSAGEYPPSLAGIAESQNSQTGFRSPPPVLIGDQERALSVIAGGSVAPKIGFHRMEPPALAAVAPRRLEAA